jgi:hypothetical protein
LGLKPGLVQTVLYANRGLHRGKALAQCRERYVPLNPDWQNSKKHQHKLFSWGLVSRKQVKSVTLDSSITEIAASSAPLYI